MLLVLSYTLMLCLFETLMKYMGSRPRWDIDQYVGADLVEIMIAACFD